MRHLKGIPGRIFVVVLITGIIGICGILMMKFEVDRLSDDYHVIMDEYVENRELMSRILGLIYKHRSVMADSLLVSESDAGKQREQMEMEVRTELQETLKSFGERMLGNEREMLYHALYSTFQSYLQTVLVAEELYQDGNIKTASEYISTNMVETADKINGQIQELDELIVSEMVAARENIDEYTDQVKLNALVSTVLIIAAVVICLIYCVRITATLEKQRVDLMQKVRLQTEELRQHNDQMLDIKDQTIIGMANLIENRDGDTGEHIKRTSMYVSMIANEAKKIGYCRGTLTSRYIELLVKAAPMHDVGKIVVPDHILKKPGRLDEEEFKQIKRHAAEGGRIVREVLGNIEDNDYVEIAAQIAEGHHEKWDGSGYPRGRKEDEIPLCARIMAVADVYDALVAKRCYKDAMSCDQAMTIIEESAGSHFDPTLVNLFLGMREDIRKISDASPV